MNLTTLTISKKRHALIAARKNTRLSQVEVAEIVGVSQANISRYESGEQNPTMAVAFKISQLYKSDIGTLFL